MKTENQTRTLEFINKIVLGIMAVSMVVWLFGGNPDITEAAKLLMFAMVLAYTAIQNVIYKYEIGKNEGKFFEYANELKKANKLIEDWKNIYTKAEKINQEQADKMDYLQKKNQNLSNKLDESYAKNNDLNTELHTWKELADYAAKIEFKSDKKYAADRIREMLESKFNEENKTDEH